MLKNKIKIKKKEMFGKKNYYSEYYMKRNTVKTSSFFSFILFQFTFPPLSVSPSFLDPCISGPK
jgi:hypothetical protein